MVPTNGNLLPTFQSNLQQKSRLIGAIFWTQDWMSEGDRWKKFSFSFVGTIYFYFDNMFFKIIDWFKLNYSVWVLNRIFIKALFNFRTTYIYIISCHLAVHVRWLFSLPPTVYWSMPSWKICLQKVLILKKSRAKIPLVIGGSLEFQVSKIVGCEMVRQDDMSFDFYVGSCNSFSHPKPLILLCFDYSHPSECHT